MSTPNLPPALYTILINTKDWLGEHTEISGIYETLEDANEDALSLLTEHYGGLLPDGFLQRWIENQTIEYSSFSGVLLMDDFPEETNTKDDRNTIEPLRVHVERHELTRSRAVKQTNKRPTSPHTSAPSPKRQSPNPSVSFQSVPIYEFVTITTTIIKDETHYSEEETRSETESRFFLKKENAIGALHDTVKYDHLGESGPSDDEAEVVRDPEERVPGVRYGRDGLPSYEKENLEEYERVFMQVKVRPYEVLFRGNGNRGDLTEVVTTLAVEDWDGTRAEYQVLLGEGAATNTGSSESPVVID